jgi:hypothetical protein
MRTVVVRSIDGVVDELLSCVFFLMFLLLFGLYLISDSLARDVLTDVFPA